MEIKSPTSIVAGCVEVYDNVIDNPEKIIKISESYNNWKDSEIFTNLDSSQQSHIKEIRSNSSLLINQFSYEIDHEIYEMCKTVWRYSDKYAKKYNFSFYSTENIQILKYSDGEFYKPHVDAGINVPRVVSAILYLNDVGSGGETRFENFDINISPKAGRLVIFPSNYAYMHSALPPKNDVKYAAVFWMHG